MTGKPNPITRYRECGVCRQRVVCTIDHLGRWLCVECRACFDA